MDCCSLYPAPVHEIDLHQYRTIEAGCIQAVTGHEASIIDRCMIRYTSDDTIDSPHTTRTDLNLHPPPTTTTTTQTTSVLLNRTDLGKAKTYNEIFHARNRMPTTAGAPPIPATTSIPLLHSSLCATARSGVSFFLVGDCEFAQSKEKCVLIDSK